MRATWDEVWRFETVRFAIVAEVTDCLDDPADHFQFPDDIESVRSGSVAWFNARVRVLLRDTDEEIGADYLGCCAYDKPLDLFRHHATLTSELRRLRGRTGAKSRRDRKSIKEVLANNIKLDPPVSYCEYGPSMVWEACRAARHTLRRMQEIRMRETVE